MPRKFSWQLADGSWWSLEANPGDATVSHQLPTINLVAAATGRGPPDGGRDSSARGWRCAPTGVGVSPNGGFDLPQRRVSLSPTERKPSPDMTSSPRAGVCVLACVCVCDAVYVCVFACQYAVNAVATSPAMREVPPGCVRAPSTIGRLPSGARPSPCAASRKAGSACGGGISRPAHSVSAEHYEALRRRTRLPRAHTA